VDIKVRPPVARPARLTRRLATARLAAVGLVLAALVAVVAGCGGGGASASATTGQAGGGSVPAQLRFDVATVDGGRLDGTSLAGRPTVLWFWAPWCPICHGEAPEIARARQKFGDKVQFVGVAGLGTVAEMRKFVADTNLGTFPHAVDADGRLWASFGVDEQPALSFITADGKVKTLQGLLSEAELNMYTERLVTS
jgi:thiol-disulfide isomerase/thioredoxin